MSPESNSDIVTNETKNIRLDREVLIERYIYIYISRIKTER